MQNQELYVAIGLSYAGKSTTGRGLVRFAQSNRNRVVHVVSFDQTRREMQEEGRISQGKFVYNTRLPNIVERECLRRTADKLSQGDSVFVDTLNLTRERRNQYRSLGNRFDAATFFLYHNLPLELLRERHREDGLNPSPLRARVTTESLEDKIKKAEHPGADEVILEFKAPYQISNWLSTHFILF